MRWQGGRESENIEDRRGAGGVGFYRQLRDRFQASGDFAQAYIIAHEVGHHVQNLLGIADRVHQAQQRAGGRAEANARSVRSRRT